MQCTDTNHHRHRKCGRVVCAACSPHRITIPSAFVVKPPPAAAVAPPSTPPRERLVIDLTSSPASSSSSSTSVHRRSGSWSSGAEASGSTGTNRGAASAGSDDDVGEDEEEEEEEEEEDSVSTVRICEDCLLGRRISTLPQPQPYAGSSASHFPGSREVAVPHGTRRRRSSVSSAPSTLPFFPVR